MATSSKQGTATIQSINLAVPEDKTIVIGITGEPGAGKSALSQEFAKLGATVIDVDGAGHEVIELPSVKKKLIEAFGEEIIGEDGAIVRGALAARAFASEEQTAKLNQIVSGQLSRRIKTTLKKSGNFVVIDAARLHELGLDESTTMTVYVRAPQEQRASRVLERGWSSEELEQRDSALGDADERRVKCKLTVDNSGDLELLEIYARTILARQLGIDLNAKQRRDDRNGDDTSSDDTGSDDETQLDEQSVRPPPPPPRDPVHAILNDYIAREVPDLQGEAEELGVRDVRWLSKDDLICEILRRVAGTRQDDIVVEGFIELGPKAANGYLRSQHNEYQNQHRHLYLKRPATTLWPKAWDARRGYGARTLWQRTLSTTVNGHRSHGRRRQSANRRSPL